MPVILSARLPEHVAHAPHALCQVSDHSSRTALGGRDELRHFLDSHLDLMGTQTSSADWQVGNCLPGLEASCCTIGHRCFWPRARILPDVILNRVPPCIRA